MKLTGGALASLASADASADPGPRRRVARDRASPGRETRRAGSRADAREGDSRPGEARPWRRAAAGLALLVTFAVRSPAVAQEAPAAPSLVADAERFDFGDAWRGEALRHAFVLSNAGSDTVEIEEIKNGCACMVASFAIGGRTLSRTELAEARPVGRLAPGETATLEIVLQTARIPSNEPQVQVRKVVRIFSSDPARKLLTLSLEATVAVPYVLEPGTLDLGRLRSGSGTTGSARIRSSQLDSFDITGATTAAPDLLRAAATRVATAGDAVPEWRIDVELLPGAPLGTVLSHVELVVDHPRLREILIPVRFTVEPNVEFLTGRTDRVPRLEFGELAQGGPGATLELRIVNHRPEVPYVPTSAVLERCRPTAEGFSAEIVEQEPGVRYLVRLVAPPALPNPTFFQGELVITADHPEIPRQRVGYRGWYRERS